MTLQQERSKYVAIREWSEKTCLTFQETEHAGEDTLVFRSDGKVATPIQWGTNKTIR